MTTYLIERGIMQWLKNYHRRINELTQLNQTGGTQ